MAVPTTTVQIAFTSGYTTPAASRTWTDVTDYVEGDRDISINRGRAEEDGQPQPSRLTLTLNNRDGRFTPEYAAGANYPNVKKGRPIRVRSEWPVSSGIFYDRFVGYIDEWPVEWPGGSDAWSTVPLSATSRMARLGRSVEFRSIVEEEISYDSPVLHFPLGEPADSTTAGNIAPGRTEALTVTQVGTGGTLEFGQGIGPGTDDLAAPVFTPVSAGNALYLRGVPIAPLSAVGDTVLDVEVWFVTSAATNDIFSLRAEGVGAVNCTLQNASGNMSFAVGLGANFSSVSLGSTVADGLLHQVVARITLSGGSLTASMIVDGGSRLTAGTSMTAQTALPTWTRIMVGNSGDTAGGNPFTGTIAHFAIYSGSTAVADARIQTRYSAGATGFSGEASGARVARYARLAGIPTAEVTVESGLSASIAHKDTTGETPLGLMQAVADTEGGVVFDGKDGTLTFHARSHRYASTSAFTLDATAGDVEEGLLPKLDDHHLSNDVTASRPDGVTIRSTNAASITEYGYYRATIDVLTTSDNEVQARADWEVNRFGTPRVIIPNVTNDLTSSSSAKVTSLLAADIGTRLTVSNLPSQAPATTLDFFVEGVAETIGPETHRIEFNTSAAAYADVWILDSSTVSVLDSTTVLAY
jgi:hypothetical protein